jgi:hypothetical protein
MVRCPTCGKVREMFRSDYKRLKSDFCRACAEPERQRNAREAVKAYWATRRASAVSRGF